MEESIRVRVAALIVENGAILLVLHLKEGRRYYLLPGGGMEKGETEEAALKRELLEETGLSAMPLRLLFETLSVFPHGDRRMVQRVYYCAAAGAIAPSQDPRVVKCEWVARAAFPSVPFFPNIKADILKAWDQGFASAPFQRLEVKWEEA